VAAVALNAADRDPAFSIAPDGLLCQARLTQQWCGARADVGIISGAPPASAACMLLTWRPQGGCITRPRSATRACAAWAGRLRAPPVTSAPTLPGAGSGAQLEQSKRLTRSHARFGYGGTGKRANSRRFEDYGQAFGKGDVIGCLLDADTGAVEFSKNGARRRLCSLAVCG
jgi:ATP-dependent RNA helicase DDX1